jgi:hypothetical protein
MIAKLVTNKELSQLTGIPYNTIKTYASQNHPAYIKQVKKWNLDKWVAWVEGALEWVRNKKVLEIAEAMEKKEEGVEQLV